MKELWKNHLPTCKVVAIYWLLTYTNHDVMKLSPNLEGHLERSSSTGKKKRKKKKRHLLRIFTVLSFVPGTLPILRCPKLERVNIFRGISWAKIMRQTPEV